MFLDAGGVIVLPHRGLVRAALTDVGVEIEPSAVPGAHYSAVRRLDRSSSDVARKGYWSAFCKALGVPPGRMRDAVRALSDLADRERSGRILWSEAVPHARRAIDALMGAGIAVLVITNSDGHAAENLRDAKICQTTAGPGAIVLDVVDSGLVGSEKPDPAIFLAALERARVQPTAAVHVGDMKSSDVAGARAAGIVPITSIPVVAAGHPTTATFAH